MRHSSNVGYEVQRCCKISKLGTLQPRPHNLDIVVIDGKKAEYTIRQWMTPPEYDQPYWTVPHNSDWVWQRRETHKDACGLHSSCTYSHKTECAALTVRNGSSRYTERQTFGRALRTRTSKNHAGRQELGATVVAQSSQ